MWVGKRLGWEGLIHERGSGECEAIGLTCRSEDGDSARKGDEVTVHIIQEGPEYV